VLRQGGERRRFCPLSGCGNRELIGPEQLLRTFWDLGISLVGVAAELIDRVSYAAVGTGRLSFDHHQWNPVDKQGHVGTDVRSLPGRRNREL